MTVVFFRSSINIDNKNVIFIDGKTGEEENINYLIMYGSKYLQIPSGKSTFRSGADSGEDNLETTMEFLPEYEAV